MTVLEYLRTHFKRSNKTSHTIIEITNRFKEESRDQLNALHKQGLVKRVNGANLVIVEYLPEKDTEHDTN